LPFARGKRAFVGQVGQLPLIFPACNSDALQEIFRLLLNRWIAVALYVIQQELDRFFNGVHHAPILT